MDSSNEKEKGSCVATLITKKHAITAAHCFAEGFSPFSVDINGDEYDVDKVYLNKCFSFENDGPNGQDLAIIRLETIDDDSVTIYPIYLAGDEVGKTFSSMGWGL